MDEIAGYITGIAFKLSNIKATNPISLRDKAILELLYSSGLRLSELVSLNPIDLNLKNKSMTVQGKGEKTRLLPIGQKAIVVFDQWLEVRGQLAHMDEEALFVSSKGSRLSQRAVQSRIDHWAKQTGMQQNIYPHLLRHSFATHLLNRHWLPRDVWQNCALINVDKCFVAYRFA
jgi:integrase/recombinase XerC